MTEPTPKSAISSASKTNNLGDKVASGMVWGILITLVSKASSMLTTLIMTYLLSPGEMGIVGMAYTVTTMAGVIQWGGLQHILTQRQKYLQRWINPACWISITQGLTASLVMIIAAPIARDFYRQPQIVGLILILAINPLISSLNLIPSAHMQIQLRFRQLAIWGMFTALLTMALTTTLAARPFHFGVYSFVIPTPIISIINLIAFSRITKTPWPRLRPEFHRWKLILKDSATLFTSGLFYTAILQGDYAVLGFVEARQFNTFGSAYLVGLYSFAFMLSMQVISMLATNLNGVLFPALAKLQDDPQRQLRAYLNAMQTLAFITIPACFFQTVAMDSIFFSFFPTKWEHAITLAKILSVGMTIRTVSWSASSLILSQGRYRDQCLWYTLTAPIFLLMVFIGATYNDVMGAALAECLFFTLIEPWFIYLAIKKNGGTFINIVQYLSKPVLTGLICATVVLYTTLFIPATTRFQHLGRLGLMIFIAAVIYWGVMRFLYRNEFIAMASKFNKLLPPRLTFIKKLLPAA